MLATRVTSLFALASVAMPSFALQSDRPTPANTMAISADDQQAAISLAAAIQGEIANQPLGASTADVEAAIVFRISQGTYSEPVLSDALDSVGTDANPVLRAAINNVRLALLRRKLKRGTAAIGDGAYGDSTGTGNGGGFSSPGTSTGGGGSANYSN